MTKYGEKTARQIAFGHTNLNPRALKKLREKDSQGQLLLKANQGGSRPLTISVRQSNGSQWQQCFIEGVNSNSSSYDSEQYKQFR